uniref:Cytochrome c oxidase subunit 3 n=3 Tax=Oryza TaxID=4527 RepID=A0A0E0BQY4_9ORYZ
MGVKGGLHTTGAKWFMIESQRHSYHLVDPSPWPISGSLGALATTVGGVMYMHSFQGGATLLSLGLIFLLYTMFVWWRDVLRESTLEGHHTKAVQLGPRYGSILFIVSEVMFLFAFFWASSHSSLAPTVEIGGIWPPKGIGVLDPWEIPLLNTPILPSSGAAVTWAHHAILAGKEKRAVYALVATVSLALVSTGFQGMEYYQAPSTISDSIYGSTFFLATGFHGFHVIIGTLFLIMEWNYTTLLYPLFRDQEVDGQLTKDYRDEFHSNCGLRRMASWLLKLEIPCSRNERVNHPGTSKNLLLTRQGIHYCKVLREQDRPTEDVARLGLLPEEAAKARSDEYCPLGEPVKKAGAEIQASASVTCFSTFVTTMALAWAFAQLDYQSSIMANEGTQTRSRQLEEQVRAMRESMDKIQTDLAERMQQQSEEFQAQKQLQQQQFEKQVVESIF